MDFVKGQAKGQDYKSQNDRQRNQGEALCPYGCLPYHKCHKCCVTGHLRTSCKNPKKKRTKIGKKVHEVQNEEEKVGPQVGILPTTEVKLQTIPEAKKADEECCQIRDFCVKVTQQAA